MYCHYVTININTNHTCIDEEHKTCVILVLVKKDDDTKTITDCTNCVVNRKILTLTRKKTILSVDCGYGSTKHKWYHFQCKPVTLIWISFGKFAWPLQVASQASRLYIRKHNAWRGDRHRHSKNAFPFGSGLRSFQNFFSFIKSKVGESCDGYSHGNCYCYEDHAIKVESHLCDAEVYQWAR